MLSGEYTLMHLAGGIIKIKFCSGFIEARVLLYTVFIYVFYIYYFIQNKTSPKLDLAHRRTDANCIHRKDNAPKPLVPITSEL